jgi:protoporphyrinogen oxidase
VRWLRPEYQNPSAQTAPQQSEAELDDTTDAESAPEASTAAGKLTWPKQMREQVAAVRHALSQSPLPADALAAQFKRSPKVAVQAVLDALEELGMVQQDADQYRLAS